MTNCKYKLKNLVLSVLILSTFNIYATEGLKGVLVSCSFDEIIRDTDKTQLVNNPRMVDPFGKTIMLSQITGYNHETFVTVKTGFPPNTEWWQPSTDQELKKHCNTYCKSQAMSYSKQLPPGVAVKSTVNKCEKHDVPPGTDLTLLLGADINISASLGFSMERDAQGYNEETGHGQWVDNGRGPQPWSNNIVALPQIASASASATMALPDLFDDARWKNVNIADELQEMVNIVHRVAPDLLIDAILVAGTYKITELLASRGRSIASPAYHFVAVAFIVSQLDNIGLWDELTDEEQAKFQKYY